MNLGKTERRDARNNSRPSGDGSEQPGAKTASKSVKVAVGGMGKRSDK